MPSMVEPELDGICQCPNQALQADVDRRIAETLSNLDTRNGRLWCSTDREENGRAPPLLERNDA